MRKKKARKNKDFNIAVLDEFAQKVYEDSLAEYSRTSLLVLRETARKMGVQSATTYAKQPLIEEMARARLQHTVYCPPVQNAAAPVSCKDVSALTDDYLQKSFVVSADNVHGLLKIESDGAWLVKGFVRDEKTDVFVPMIMVNELGLIEGDEIWGRARFLQDAGRPGLFKAERINGSDADSFIRREIAPAVSPDRIMAIEGTYVLSAMAKINPFCKGERRIIIGLDGLKLFALAEEISLRFSLEGIETVNLFLDESPERIDKLAILRGKTLALCCDSFAEYDAAVLLAVKFALSAAAAGRNVGIVLNNAGSLKEETVYAVLGASRLTQKGSITVALLSSTLELTPLMNRISHTANAVCVLHNNLTGDPLIDLNRTFADSERLLSPDERDVLKACRSECRRYISARDFLSVYNSNYKLQKK